MFRRHPILSAMTFAYLAFVGWVTLGPQPVDTAEGSMLANTLALFAEHPLTRWLTYSRVEFLANVGMFVPVGVLFLLLLGRRLWPRAVLAGFALTCAIEGVQLFLPHRFPDVRDLLANSLGGLIGVLVALVVLAVVRARRSRMPEGATQ